MTKPVIGLTLDIEAPGEGKFSPFCDWYALRDNYSNAIAKHAAVPTLLPHHTDMVSDYLDMLDGIITTGGDFDVDPALYGETEIHPKVTIKRGRTDFEFALIEGAIERDMPILGICGGEQLISVVRGGTLMQHVPDEVQSDIAHEQGKSETPIPVTQSSHDISIKEGTKLFDILGTNSLHVNSTHHQAVKEPGEGVIVTASALDGVIEAIEIPDHKFCIGVQWHPEYEINDAETKLFEAFVKACKS